MTNPVTFIASWRSSAVGRFVADDRGQDMVEYALAAAFIGVAGYLALGAISGTVAAVYSGWSDPASGVPSLWDPPAPGGGGS